MNRDELINILRCPHGRLEATIRKARLAAADEIERLAKEAAELRASVPVATPPTDTQLVREMAQALRYAKQDLKGLLQLFGNRLEPEAVLVVEGTVSDAVEAIAKAEAYLSAQPQQSEAVHEPR